MNVAKIIRALGIVIILPSAASAQPEPKAALCTPAVLDCPVQVWAVAVLQSDCDKHGTGSPAAVSGTTGTPVEQPCKGIIKPATSAETGKESGAGTKSGTEKAETVKGSGDTIDLKKD